MSGLIFVALALVWAVVLLPKALRQHDEVAQTRSVDKVSESMRVLARREAVSEREARLVRTPPVRQASPAPADPAPVRSAPVQPAPVQRSTVDRAKTRMAAQRKAAAAAARRRRAILLVLLVAAMGVGVAAGLEQLPVWTAGLPIVVTFAFLVLARVLVRREHQRWDAELVELKALAHTSPALGVSETETPHLAAPEAVETDEAVAAVEVEIPASHNEQGLAVVSGLDDTSSFPFGLLDDATPTTDAGSLWDPMPVTLPTYVSKPRASRSVRTIDLQAPDVSSSGHDTASSALVADAATSSPPDDLPQQAVGS